jgi:hypothetical protein
LACRSRLDLRQLLNRQAGEVLFVNGWIALASADAETATTVAPKMRVARIALAGFQKKEALRRGHSIAMLQMCV